MQGLAQIRYVINSTQGLKNSKYNVEHNTLSHFEYSVVLNFDDEMFNASILSRAPLMMINFLYFFYQRISRVVSYLRMI